MAKVTIEIGDTMCTVSQDSAEALDDMISLVSQALKGCGFEFDDTLMLVENYAKTIAKKEEESHDNEADNNWP